ncbi:undecaprenyl diphosphate synthase [Senna tora]|uniref:Undecaprenyl diphosphate synthase n=1 Tax=Senna tora TaxID=362788 RepID=A0A834TGW9_9FABA|nr:undecaprenyl diphosphate synthase [Senna tora]
MKEKYKRNIAHIDVKQQNIDAKKKRKREIREIGRCHLLLVRRMNFDSDGWLAGGILADMTLLGKEMCDFIQREIGGKKEKGLWPKIMLKYVVVIMDENGQWAKMRGLSSSAGHRYGR